MGFPAWKGCGADGERLVVEDTGLIWGRWDMNMKYRGISRVDEGRTPAGLRQFALGAAASALLAGLLLSGIALGHHSDAGLDMDRTVTLEGTIKQFFWRNPHVYFTVEVPDAEGRLVEWSVQMGSTITSARQGWGRDTLVPGDRVVVEAHPATNGRPYAIVDSIDKEGGLGLGRAFVEPAATLVAQSIEGRWLQRDADAPQHPGGIDGYFRTKLRPTAKGIEAQAAFDALSAENPEAECIGRPTPAMIHSSTRYPIEISIDEAGEVVTIRSQYWDELRTVYMHGRGHPAREERYPSGHSTGRWEDGTLVVDTRNFADHRSPYQIGLPSGPEKHVVERFGLIDGGRRLRIEFMLEDPEYIVEPMHDFRELVYVPDMEMTPFDCDAESTRRFLSGAGAH